MKNYRSIYGAGDITIGQYIAELMVSRQAKWKKVNLPDRFWKDESYIQWTKTFRIQKMRVDALHKSGYDYSVILKALNSSQGQYIASLHNKKLDFLLEEEQRKIDLEKEVAKPQPNLEISSVEKVSEEPKSKKTSIISKLRD